MTNDLLRDIIIQAITPLGTLAVLLFKGGSFVGKREVDDEHNKAHHEEIGERLEQIDAKIDAKFGTIDERLHLKALAIQELKTLLVGVNGNNGLNSVIKGMDARVRDIESRRDTKP